MGGGQNTYNLLKNKGRNKKIITIIIFLVLIVVSISFALFNPSINLLGRRNIKISKCELDINFKESDELMLVSKYPISTRQALEGDYKPKKITITNNSTCDTAYYKLTIKDLINSSINKDKIQYHVVDKQNTMTYKLGDTNGDGQIKTPDKTIAQRYVNDFAFNFLNYTLIAADLNGDGQVDATDIDLYTKYMSTKEITTFPAGTPLEEKTTTKEIIDINPDTFLIESSLEKGQTHEYEIIMWISNTATNTDLYENGDTTKPIEYKYALNIEASDEEIKNKAMTASEFALANVGQNGLEQITHTIDNTLQVDSKFATEYRYRGGNVANYVTFNNEVWRIIGVIPTEDTSGNVENRFKIIRDASIGDMKWNTTQDTSTSSYNNWVTGTLNTYLNNDYYNTLTTDAQSMIGTTKYYLGGYNNNPNITTDVMWKYERKNEASRTGYYYGTNPIMQNDANKKIAIMYASDYGYAASKECTSNLIDYDDSASCKTTNNWLDKSQDAWLLPQGSKYPGIAFDVESSGYVYYGGNVNVREYAVRPVLYLSSNVKISSGKGTSEQPYQLSIS